MSRVETKTNTIDLPFNEAKIEVEYASASSLVFKVMDSDTGVKDNFWIPIPTQFKYEKKHLAKVGATYDIVIHRYMSKDIQHGMLIPLDHRIKPCPEHVSSFKHISRPKTYHTHNKWTEVLRIALRKEVEKGKTLDQIFASSKKFGLPYTKYAIATQIRLMGYSIKKGKPMKKEVSTTIGGLDDQQRQKDYT
jgi:hypothetical protein